MQLVASGVLIQAMKTRVIAAGMSDDRGDEPQAQRHKRNRGYAFRPPVVDAAFCRAKPEGASQRRSEGLAVHRCHPATNRLTAHAATVSSDARRHDGPSRNVDRPKFEAVDGVPDEMTDATAQMQEEGEGAAEQHDLADPGSHHALNDAIGPGPAAAALSQITRPTAPRLRITPVMRLAIDKTDVSCGR